MILEKSKRFMNRSEVKNMEQSDNILKKCGTVIFLAANKGSKSEGVYPYLYETDGICTRIMLKDDNPFENSGLRSFDGQHVEILCEKGRGEILVVNQIEKKSNCN